VAVDIVDRLEIIEVHDEECAGLALRQVAGPFVEILDEPAAVGKPGEKVVAGQLMRLGLGLPPQGNLAVQVDDAANGVNFGRDAEADDKDDKPIGGIALRLVGELEKAVESVIPNGTEIKAGTPMRPMTIASLA
jgi:hypothetical protein